MTLRLPFPILLLVLAACRDGHQARPNLVAGSVGEAIYNHDLTLAEVGRWWTAVRPLAVRATQDSTFHLKVNFPVDSSLTSQVAVVDGTPLLAARLREAGMSGRDFIVIGGALAAGVMAKVILDTAQKKSLPDNVNLKHLRFVQQNAAALDSIEQ